jgi:hypothetical protein
MCMDVGTVLLRVSVPNPEIVTHDRYFFHGYLTGQVAACALTGSRARAPSD